LSVIFLPFFTVSGEALKVLPKGRVPQ
jgi:hypothetical protein